MGSHAAIRAIEERRRGAVLAIRQGMAQNIHADDWQTDGARVWRVVRAFAEAALVAVAFALAILLIGLPFALLGRVLHELMAWMTAA